MTGTACSHSEATLATGRATWTGSGALRRAARVLLALLVVIMAFTGCASVDPAEKLYAWTPTPAAGRLDAHVRVEARHVFGQELEESALMINKEGEREGYRKLVLRDISQSGLFTSVNTPGRQPDLLLTVETFYSMPKGIWSLELKLGVSIAVQDPVTGAAVRKYARETTLQGFTTYPEIGNGFGRMLTEIRQELYADYQAGNIPSVITVTRASSAAQTRLAAARTAQTQGDYATALVAVRQALQEDPQGTAPVIAAVELLHRLCDAEGAKRLGEEARKRQPTDTALVAAMNGAGIITHAPACQAQQLNREAIALARSGQRADALAKLTEARRLAPGLVPKASYNVALLMEQTGKPQEAVQAYLEAQRGFLTATDQQEALTRLVALAQRTNLPAPDAADRRYRLGIVRAQQKRYPEAVTEFEAALTAAPWLVDAYYNLGLVYDFTNAPAPALQAMRTYLLLAPQSPQASAVKTKIVELEDKLGMEKK